MSVKKAVIPVAGFATRFLPACKSLPKCMLTIVDKPIIQYLVDEAVASGIEDILLVVGRKKEVVEDYFSEDKELEDFLIERGKESFISQVTNLSGKAKIHFIEEEGGAKGLGHAIYMAKDFVGNEPFAVMLGDDVVDSKVPCLKQLIDCYSEYNTSILGVQKVPEDQVNKYGIINGRFIEDRVYKVNDLVEKPSPEEAPSNIAILGRYIITPEIFKHIENTKPGKGGEIQLTDALKSLITQEVMYAYEFDGKRYDVGDKLGFLQATIEYALKKPELRDNFVKYLESKPWEK